MCTTSARTTWLTQHTQKGQWGIVLTVTPRCRKERSSGTHKTIIPADGKGLWLVAFNPWSELYIDLWWESDREFLGPPPPCASGNAPLLLPFSHWMGAQHLHDIRQMRSPGLPPPLVLHFQGYRAAWTHRTSIFPGILRSSLRLLLM